MTILATQAKIIRVPMGELVVGESPDILETLLGSCVGIAVWDERSGCGGLAHTVLPEAYDLKDPVGRFVNTAVLELKKRLQEKGASPYSLKAKLAGGAIMFGNEAETVGRRNCEAALHCLAEQKIPVIAEHLGGNRERKIRFSLKDWSLQVEMARKIVTVI